MCVVCIGISDNSSTKLHSKPTTANAAHKKLVCWLCRSQF